MASSLMKHWWRSAETYNGNIWVGQDSELQVGDISALITTPRARVLRELERLAVVAKDNRDLEEARCKLMEYKCGDFWVPTGGLVKEEMGIPQANVILLVGLKGSGKSSLVNMMYSVLGRSGLIPFARTSSGKSGESATTMYLEEHNVARSPKGGFCVFDSRGIDHARVNEGLEELSEWMSDGVRHNQPCNRWGDPPMGVDVAADVMSRCSRYVERKVNCVVVVVDMAEAYQGITSDQSKPIESIKDIFACLGNFIESPPLLVLTHGDQLPSDERINGRIKICEALGISETSGAYDIPCLTEYGIPPEESDPVAAYAVAELVYRALLISDRNHLPKREAWEWAWVVLSGALWFLGAVFACLANFCAGLGQKKRGRGFMY